MTDMTLEKIRPARCRVTQVIEVGKLSYLI